MRAQNTAASAGIGFGSALAITISWSQWHSILWAILHGCFSWFYVEALVAYFAARSPVSPPSGRRVVRLDP
jgi:hypothetical protein